MRSHPAVPPAVPDVKVFVGHPPVEVSMTERLAGKKVIVVGLPGAFTPT
jgi:peroxiredoxin